MNIEFLRKVDGINMIMIWYNRHKLSYVFLKRRLWDKKRTNIDFFPQKVDSFDVDKI